MVLGYLQDRNITKVIIDLNNNKSFILSFISIADIGLYNRLLISVIIEELTEFISYIFSTLRHKYIKINLYQHQADWCSPTIITKEKNIFYLDQFNLFKHIKWICNNNLVVWLQFVWITSKSVPQSDQCSGALLVYTSFSKSKNSFISINLILLVTNS